jgi:hypothetical protein
MVDKNIETVDKKHASKRSIKNMNWTSDIYNSYCLHKLSWGDRQQKTSGTVNFFFDPKPKSTWVHQEPTLRPRNLQLHRQRCSRVERFSIL